jgi:hypothetical protein
MRARRTICPPAADIRSGSPAFAVGESHVIPLIVVGARRAGTPDAILAQLRQELRQRLHPDPGVPDVDRRLAPRTMTLVLATLRFGDLMVVGDVANVSAGGLFLRAPVLVEVGERGLVTLGHRSAPVRVAWQRGASHPDGPGLGLTFAWETPREERAALELALAILA